MSRPRPRKPAWYRRSSSLLAATVPPLRCEAHLLKDLMSHVEDVVLGLGGLGPSRITSELLLEVGATEAAGLSISRQAVKSTLDSRIEYRDVSVRDLKSLGHHLGVRRRD